MADSYWGSDKGIQEQKDFEASLPKPWKRVLESYRTFGGEQFQMHTGDNFDFRKYENDVETQAMKLYYDWDSHKPKWRLMIGKKYETKNGKITSVLEYEEHMFKKFEEAKSKTVELMRLLDC